MFYLDLFKTLEKHQVRYLLVGGLAMNLHGVPRMTMDIDIMLALDDANLAGFIDAANELGLKPVLPVPLSDLADAGQRKNWIEQRHLIAFALRGEENEPTLDILIGVDMPFEEAFSRRVSRDMAGCKINLASLADMITLKRAAGRLQDQADITQLEKLNK